jgi:hypothetical protein
MATLLFLYLVQFGPYAHCSASPAPPRPAPGNGRLPPPTSLSRPTGTFTRAGALGAPQLRPVVYSCTSVECDTSATDARYGRVPKYAAVTSVVLRFITCILGM